MDMECGGGGAEVRLQLREAGDASGEQRGQGEEAGSQDDEGEEEVFVCVVRKEKCHAIGAWKMSLLCS